MSSEKKRLNDELITKLNVVHSINQNVINIVFRNATDDVAKTIIELYRSVGKIEKGVLTEVVKRELLDTFVITDGGFKSIRDLQTGLYSYKLSQLTKDDKEIVVTDYYNFQVR